MPTSVTSAAASAALSDAFLAAAVYALVQWIIKPLIVTYWLQQDNPYQDNATRAAGFIVAYALTILNTAVQQPVTWSLAWSLLPTAAGIYASSALVYHISTPGAPTPAPVVAPAPIFSPAPPQPAAPALGAAGEVEQIVAALTALAAAIASSRAVAGPAATAVVTPAPVAPPADPAPAAPVAPPAWEALPTGDDVDPLTRALGATLAPALGATGGPTA